MHQYKKKREVWWKSPFEIYNGRKSNELLHVKRNHEFDRETVSTAYQLCINKKLQAFIKQDNKIF